MTNGDRPTWDAATLVPWRGAESRTCNNSYSIMTDSQRFYQPWWYANGGEERKHDLVAASKTLGQEHDTLDEANQEILDTDPDHEAFVSVYEDRGHFRGPEVVAEYDDPRQEKQHRAEL